MHGVKEWHLGGEGPNALSERGITGGGRAGSVKAIPGSTPRSARLYESLAARSTVQGKQQSLNAV